MARITHRELERAAEIAGASITGATFERFLLNGDALKNSRGHDVFMSVEDVLSMLASRADAIRAICTDVEDA